MRWPPNLFLRYSGMVTTPAEMYTGTKNQPKAMRTHAACYKQHNIFHTPHTSLLCIKNGWRVYCFIEICRKIGRHLNVNYKYINHKYIHQNDVEIVFIYFLTFPWLHSKVTWLIPFPHTYLIITLWSSCWTAARHKPNQVQFVIRHRLSECPWCFVATVRMVSLNATFSLFISWRNHIFLTARTLLLVEIQYVQKEKIFCVI